MSSYLPGSVCRGANPDLFVLPDGIKGSSRVGARMVAEALAFCARCPEREACLRVALEDPALIGVWGGTTDGDREQIRRGATPGVRRKPGPRPGSGRLPVVHGSDRGYASHRRRGEAPCLSCREAHLFEVRERKRASRERKAAWAVLWLSLDASYMRERLAVAYAESCGLRQTALAVAS